MINPNRDRFDNVLTTLGGASPGKNMTPPESPTGPLDKPQDLIFDEPSTKTPHKCSGSMVRINKTPTSAAPAISPQAVQETTTPQSEESMQLRLPRRPILQNSKTIQPPQQQENQPHAATNKQGDGVIHDKANKLLKEVKSGHEAYSYHIKDYTGLFPV